MKSNSKSFLPEAEALLHYVVQYLPLASAITPFTTLLLSMWTLCVYSHRCWHTFPVLSDAASGFPAGPIFGFGLVTSGFLISCSVLFSQFLLYRPIREYTLRPTISTLHRGIVLGIYLSAIVSGMLIYPFLGCVGVIPLHISDAWHVFSAEGYFGVVAVMIPCTTLLLARFPLIHGRKQALSLRIKAASALLMLALCVLLVLFHIRYVYIDLFPIPQLTYSVIEMSTVACQLVWVGSLSLDLSGRTLVVGRLSPSKAFRAA